MRRAWVVCSFASVLMACAHSTGSSDEPPPSSAATASTEPSSAATDEESRAGAKVIGSFVTHDAKVSILSSAGADDLRVTVRTRDGRIVADGISLAELEGRDPLLHAVVKSAVASNRMGTYLDATLERPTAEEPRAFGGR